MKSSQEIDENYVYDGRRYTHEELKRLFEHKLQNSKKNPDPRLVHTLTMLEGKYILDVGCAGGVLTKRMAERGFNLLGIDVLESSIKIAKEFNSMPNISYEIRDILHQPFKANSFDCITFLETIEHVENPALFLKEFYRILKPRGCLVLSTPNSTSLKNIFYALSFRKKEKRIQLANEISSEPKKTGTQLEHIYNWDFPTLVRLLYQCGFDLVDHAFGRSGPIILPIFGKKFEIIKSDSKSLNRFESLKSIIILKVRKRID